MQKTLFVLTLAAGLGMTHAASAADVYASGGMKDVSFEAPANWTGVYLGITGGIGFSAPKFSDSDEYICFDYQTCGDAQGVGGLFGGTLGYNWQMRNLVLGIEGDISWASLDAKSKTYIDCSGCQYYMQSKIDAIATARLRAGYTSGSNLFYVTGGAAFVSAKHNAIYDGYSCGSEGSSCNDEWHTGFAVGAGYEAMITSNLSFKAEYLYIGMPTDTLSNSDSSSYTYGFADNIQIARVGLNYKFGGCCSYVPLK
jgi:outer membrane immunogenic protein